MWPEAEPGQWALTELAQTERGGGEAEGFSRALKTLMTVSRVSVTQDLRCDNENHLPSTLKCAILSRSIQ